jgi:hypothetical protein
VEQSWERRSSSFPQFRSDPFADLREGRRLEIGRTIQFLIASVELQRSCQHNVQWFGEAGPVAMGYVAQAGLDV